MVVVDASEADLWSGSYVGHPIAFVHQTGPDNDQWAYGVVTSYHMRGTAAFLHTSLTVIVVDRINYALKTGYTVNFTVLDSLELVDRQDAVIAACGKSRSGIPTAVSTTMLTIPMTTARTTVGRPNNATSVAFVFKTDLSASDA
ncbi:Hypothetical protein PHPALM_6139 [Phytophthora palmivora]|uniref:Uncharacterized protein n=1 Tax=Phytophthora palmivora TaxID=4796 RepID=A0A2P4YFL5_9STRA|nr:Hypothetical protein PHPALM_6139 [Phytophthora palmivora]